MFRIDRPLLHEQNVHIVHHTPALKLYICMLQLFRTTEDADATCAHCAAVKKSGIGSMLRKRIIINYLVY